MKRRNIFFGILLAGILQILGTKDVKASSSCTFQIPDHIYVGVPFQVSVTNAVIGAAPLSGSGKIRLNSKIDQEYNIDLTNGSGSTSLNIDLVNVPVGESVAIQLISSDDNFVCEINKVLQQNPNGAPDGYTSGCCTPQTDRCSQWYGPNAVCSKSNGSCMSGFQCVAPPSSTPYIIPDGDYCTDNLKQDGKRLSDDDIYNRCLHRYCDKSSNMCVPPCAETDLICLKNRYPFIRGNSECKPDSCDCGTVVSSLQNINANRDGSYGNALNCTDSCLDDGRSSVQSGYGITASICYKQKASTCETQGCNISDTGTHNFTVDPSCLLPGQYSVDFGPNPTKHIHDITVSSKNVSPFFSFSLSSQDVGTITVKDSAQNVKCSADVVAPPPADGGTTPPPSPVPFDICAQIPKTEYKQILSCSDCSKKDSNNVEGLWTAVGCIRTDKKSIIQSTLQIGLSIAGGVALLMILAAGLIFSTSEGDPKKASEARELMTSAVSGLILIIFSVMILQFIGVSILHIPGFGST